jgi:hypothetical protein
MVIYADKIKMRLHLTQRERERERERGNGNVLKIELYTKMLSTKQKKSSF